MTNERLSKPADCGSTVEVIQAAIADQLPVSFRYERSDGAVTRHNAVYPKELFQQGHHTLMRAYCHFTRDSRVFRIDCIRSIRLSKRLPQIPLRYDVLGFLVALVLLIAVVTVLLLLSPKYRWRQLRHRLLGPQTNIEQIDRGGNAAESTAA